MAKLTKSIKAFCDEQELLRIGYEDTEGDFHVVPVWFVDVDGLYCFGTETDSLKSRSLRHKKDAGWVIDGGENRKYRGASFSGRAETIVDKASRAKVYKALGMKYFGTLDDPKFLEIYGEQDDPAATYFRLEPKTVNSWEY